MVQIEYDFYRVTMNELKAIASELRQLNESIQALIETQSKSL